MSGQISSPSASVRVRKSGRRPSAVSAFTPSEAGAADNSLPVPTNGSQSSRRASVSSGRKRATTLCDQFYGSEGYTPIPEATPTSTMEPSQPLPTDTPKSVRITRNNRSSTMTSSIRQTANNLFHGTDTATEEEKRLLHTNEEVDILQVLDPKVGMSSTLNQLQGAFIPNRFIKTPVLEIDSDNSSLEVPAKGDGPVAGKSTEPVLEEDPLDRHLQKLLKKQKCTAKRRELLHVLLASLKTPIGIFFLIYMILVVLAGGSLVLMLMIPFNSYRKKLWIEITSQILCGLFTITSLLPLPWRIKDWYHILIIRHYAFVTSRKRKALGLPPLIDKNDLPDPEGASEWVGERGKIRTGPRPDPTPPLSSADRKERAKAIKKAGEDGELASSEAVSRDDITLQAFDDKTVPKEKERSVLTDKQEARLRKSQISFSKSQTWYRPHTLPTHHATSIALSSVYCILMIGNSLFQAMLCGVMWGYNRWDRPPWTTGILIPLSFGCAIGAGVVVWLAGERAKRKAEVTAAMWEILKKEGEEFKEVEHRV